MKIRYCETPGGKIYPCQVGWGTAAISNATIVCTCLDAPMEKNCRNMVEQESPESKKSKNERRDTISNDPA
jgi:hypothetical protein